MIANPTASRVTSESGFAGILRDEQHYATGDTGHAPDAVNGSFDLLLLQSGIRTAPPVWLGLCLVAALAAGGVAWVVAENVFLAGLAAIAGLAIPIVVALVLRSRRQWQIMEQIPAMAEELARAAKPGRSVESAFRLVAGDTAAPLGDELRLAARRSEMGLDLATSVHDMPRRTGVVSMTMFTSAISMHQDTGGDLIQVLERLATAMRDRLHFTSRLRAATIASRLGTFLMVLVPVVVMLFYGIRDPLYFTQLLQSFWGRLSMGLAVTLQITGCLIAWQIMKRSARF
jgi:tight adherence protein B